MMIPLQPLAHGVTMNNEHHVETQGLFEATPVERNDICLYEERCSQNYELVS
jgi:hypothetical protein